MSITQWEGNWDTMYADSYRTQLAQIQANLDQSRLPQLRIKKIIESLTHFIPAEKEKRLVDHARIYAGLGAISIVLKQMINAGLVHYQTNPQVNLVPPEYEAAPEYSPINLGNINESREDILELAETLEHFRESAAAIQIIHPLGIEPNQELPVELATFHSRLDNALKIARALYTISNSTLSAKLPPAGVKACSYEQSELSVPAAINPKALTLVRPL